MGRTKLIALLEEQHACQWCLENLISLSHSSSSPNPSRYPSPFSPYVQVSERERGVKERKRSE